MSVHIIKHYFTLLLEDIHAPDRCEKMAAQHCVNSFSDNDKITKMSMSIYEAIIALQRSAAAYAMYSNNPR